MTNGKEKISSRYMSESFDETQAFNREAKPLIAKLLMVCAEHEIPVQISAVISNDDGVYEIVASGTRDKAERTPLNFLAAKACLTDPDVAARAVGALLMGDDAAPASQKAVVH